MLRRISHAKYKSEQVNLRRAASFAFAYAKKNDTVEFLLDPTSFTGFDCFGFGRNDSYNFGKFGATASSGIESRLALRFFHLARIVDFSNQHIRLRPEHAKNLNLLDSK